MIKTTPTTETALYGDIERTKTRFYGEDGGLVKIIETMHNHSVNYHQTHVKNGDGFTLYWYDNRGEYQKFRWYSVPDKKGNPVWYSVIVHSTIHFIHDEVKYTMKGFTKLQKHKFDQKYGESYE